MTCMGMFRADLFIIIQKMETGPSVCRSTTPDEACFQLVSRVKSGTVAEHLSPG